MRSLFSLPLCLLALGVVAHAQSKMAPTLAAVTGRARPGDVIMVEYYPTRADHILDNRVRTGAAAGPDGTFRVALALGAPSSCALYVNNAWFAAVELMPGETIDVGDPQAGTAPATRIASLYERAMEDFKRHPAFMDVEAERRLLRIARVDSFLVAAAANTAARDSFITAWTAAQRLSPEESSLLRSRFYLRPLHEIRYFNGLQDGSGRALDTTELHVLDRIHDIVSAPSSLTADVDAWLLLTELYLNHYASQTRAPRPALSGPLGTPRAMEQVSAILAGSARDAMLAKMASAGLADALGRTAGAGLPEERRPDPALSPDNLLSTLGRLDRDESLVAAARELVERHRRLLPGSLAPELALSDEKGRTVHLSEMRGKPVLLAFWTTTGDVTPDVPAQLGMLRTSLGPNVAIVGVHLGNDEAKWRSAITGLPGGIVHLNDPSEWWDGTGRAWALPQPGYAVAIGADGRIAMRGFDLFQPSTIEMFAKLAEAAGK